MAALEKIRKRAVILTIVIGLALLAFIIEDGVQASRSFFNDNTAAKVGGEKIDIMEYQKRVQEASAEDQNNPNKVDPALRQQDVLDAMIFEKLLEQEYDKVGISVSDSELTEALTGKNAMPAARQFAQQIGAESPTQAYDLIFNPTKYGVQPEQVVELRGKWNQMQEDVIKQLKMQKLYSLVVGAIQPNDLDRKQIKEDNALTATVNFVKKDYASLEDDKYPVSAEELKNAYNAERDFFKMEEPTRHLHYIAVNVAPSEKDMAAANALVDKAYASLTNYPGIDSVRMINDIRVDTAFVNLQQINDEDVKNFVAGASVGQVYKAEPKNNNYQMVKLLGTRLSLDSVNIQAVVVQGDKKLQDSVLTQLNAGVAGADIAKKNKNVRADEPAWQTVATAPDSLKTKIANAGTEFFALTSSDQGAYICKVIEKKAPKTYYSIADVTYQAYPSQATITSLTDKFQQFLNENKTSTDFAKNAQKAGYQPIEVEVTPSTPQLGFNPQFGGGVPDTRKAVKWAFDSKPGEVSPMFADNKDMLVAVALDAAYDGEYYPVEYPAIKTYLTNKIRNDKKGEALMKQYNGKAKDLAGYAKLMGTNIDTTQVVFAQGNAPKIDMSETALIGRMAAAKKGAFNGLYKGNSAVYAYQVANVEESKREQTKEELDRQFAQSRGQYVVGQQQAFMRILSNAAGVKKNLIKFY